MQELNKLSNNKLLNSIHFCHASNGEMCQLEGRKMNASQAGAMSLG